MQRIGVRMNFYEEVPEEFVAKIIKDNIKRESIKQLKKGIKSMNWTAKSGYDADDIVKNQYTVICHANIVKVPRFVRNYLLKKLYEVRRIKH